MDLDIIYMFTADYKYSGTYYKQFGVVCLFPQCKDNSQTMKLLKLIRATILKVTKKKN